MGNICCNKSLELEPSISANSTINPSFKSYKSKGKVLENTNELKNINIKQCQTNGEYKVWEQLYDFKLVKIAKLDPIKQQVFFDFSEIAYEETITLVKLVDLIDKEDNILFLPHIFEVLIAIIDFIQLTLQVKLENGVKDFFIIQFNKFILTKIDGEHKLKYTCPSLNDPYNRDDLNFRHDNLMSSFSINEGSKSFGNYLNGFSNNLTAMNQNYCNEQSNFTNNLNNYTNANSNYEDNYKFLVNSQNINTTYNNITQNFNNIQVSSSPFNVKSKAKNSTIGEIDINSYFYTKSADFYRFLKLRNFDFDEFEFFYSEAILNFINRFLLKKISTILISEALTNEIKNFKNIIRSCFKELKKEKLTLSKLKEFLCSLLYNNHEFGLMINRFNDFINKNESIEYIYNKLLDYKKINLNFVYGNCCNKLKTRTTINTSTRTSIGNNAANKDKNSMIMPYVTNNKNHVHCFIYDHYKKINKEDALCLGCVFENYFIKKVKYERTKLKDLEEYILNLNSKSSKTNIDFFYYLKFICFLQPINIETSITKSCEVDNSQNNISTFSVTKNMLGVKEFSDLLIVEKDRIFVSKDKELCSLIFEFVEYDNDFNPFYDIVNFDLYLKDRLITQIKRSENSMLFVTDPDLSKSRGSGVFRFSNFTDKSGYN